METQEYSVKELTKMVVMIQQELQEKRVHYDNVILMTKDIDIKNMEYNLSKLGDIISKLKDAEDYMYSFLQLAKKVKAYVKTINELKEN